MTVRAKRLSPSGKPSAPSSCESIPHCDHVGGCAPIIEAMPVAMMFDSGQTYSGRAYRDCIASAYAHNVPIVLARRGMRWTSGDGVTLDVLAPSMPFLAETGDDVNENSIVVMLSYQAFSELFMGDAGEASESRILAPCHPEQRRGAAEDMTGAGPSISLGMTACEVDLHADVGRCVVCTHLIRKRFTDAGRGGIDLTDRLGFVRLPGARD